MGGYLLFNIEFEDKASRDKFEKLTKFRRMFQYEDESYDCFYYPIWLGYAEPQEIKEKCKKIKIIKFLFIDLSTNSSWYDIMNERTYD